MDRLCAIETARFLFWSGSTPAGIATDTGLADAIVRAFPAAGKRITHACEDFPAVRFELRLLATTPSSDHPDHEEAEAA